MLRSFPAITIQGPRQAGKSTLARMLVGEEATIATLDDEETRAALSADPKAFLDQHRNSTLVLDEVQRLPSLLLELKASIDRDRQPGRFVLTGSVNLLHVSGIEESLAGRIVDLPLRPLSVGEVLDASDDFVGAVVSGTIDIPTVSSTWTRSDYLTAMETGGYPELQGMSQRMRRRWIDAYLARVLSRDVASVPGGSNPERLHSTLRLLAANQSGELVKARLAQAAGYPETMVTGYMDALRSVYLLDVLRPWTQNLTKREVGRPKVSVADPALAMHLAGQSAASLTPLTADGVGALLEGFVTSQLRAQQGWSEEDFNLFHYRDRSGKEVDLIIELHDGRVIGIEVKASSSYRAEQFAGLQFLRERLGERFIGGFVLGMSDHGYQYAERLWGLPISALWASPGPGRR
ncbi:ATP-binding protein [Actinomyces faecalis]|uniref:ATP-binding protein n=1 Tax=Actinomyces faecalis TaxID=2722820 RepID=UPI0015554F3C|nr:ATP-binding protein [Actinomyces faecalis]